ncbi:Nuclear transcription factor Y subunit C-9 [Hibiscus syriacus]|uniref:Nuclear transcription factor Y subunit C-9 n=1 Tax=Hibiscus syriacus TaxID=106335 RepID=A0A6A2X582_HIBSY|nr:Nuclear transcription factor Y subunit C-9 [Hibiscus syriacus]
MDVFIPEEYVIRRRIEKKAAKRSSNMEVSRRMEIEEKKKTELQSPFRLDGGEFLVSGGISETVVFSCLSA